MSDLSLQLQQAASQLPVSSYFDDALFQRELDTIFQRGPRYVGHQLAVPNTGDYYALPQEGEGRALVRNAQGGIELVSNVCRHRQAVMLKGKGSLNTQQKGSAGGNIVCPLHRWTYNPQGELLGAPHFAHDPCLNLNNYKLREWNGLLFEDNGYDVAADLAQMGPRADLDFDGYVLDHVELHECNYNWKTFIEVFLEDYHVEPFHPGLGKFVSCDDLKWEFGDWHSVQTVGLHKDLKQPGTPVYRKWHEQILRFNNGRLPKYGAIWLTYYPNLMVEWYPNVLVVSSLIPRGPGHTTNIVEFYYPEEVVWFEREMAEAERAAYLETAAEDDEIALRMDAGRKALMERGLNQTGPYQSPMEDGMQHFHEFLRRELGDDELENTDIR